MKTCSRNVHVPRGISLPSSARAWEFVEGRKGDGGNNQRGETVVNCFGVRIIRKAGLKVLVGIDPPKISHTPIIFRELEMEDV